jgi:hypothetical protein
MTAAGLCVLGQLQAALGSGDDDQRTWGVVCQCYVLMAVVSRNVFEHSD